jgi:uncharacterized protein YxjI
MYTSDIFLFGERGVLMNLYLKQKVFSWGDKFNVYDEMGNEKYRVEGEVFTLGKKLHVYDMYDREAVYIHQKVWSFLPKYYVNIDGEDIAEVRKEFTFMRHRFTVGSLGWTVEGDFWAHEYTIMAGDEMVAYISKKWFAWVDAYYIRIAPGVSEVTALAVVLIIDACLAAEAAAAASS